MYFRKTYLRNLVSPQPKSIGNHRGRCPWSGWKVRENVQWRYECGVCALGKTPGRVDFNVLEWPYLSMGPIHCNLIMLKYFSLLILFAYKPVQLPTHMMKCEIYLVFGMSASPPTSSFLWLHSLRKPQLNLAFKFLFQRLSSSILFTKKK